MPTYCRRCVLPDNRPGVQLDDQGTCSGCRYAAQKNDIDWRARAEQFRVLVSHAKKRGADYDCVIPVSGGKDSFWQVVTCLEHGLRPLCVTYVYPGRTMLGCTNLRQLMSLGADHVEFRLDPRIEKVFIEKAFRRTGIAGLVSHMAIYSAPVRWALSLDIPLVIYGENSAFEYGTEDESLVGARVDAKWLRQFGVTAGTVAPDWCDADLPERSLSALVSPSAEVLNDADVRAVFLGYYHRWDPVRSKEIAIAHGFRSRAEGPRVGHEDFVNIDDDMIGVHHHPKWHKFGITRSWDTLSMEIRAGRLSRDEAVAYIREHPDETPWDDIRVFCKYLDISVREYFEIVEGFRDQSLWSRGQDQRWKIPNFLVSEFEWPADPVFTDD